MYLTIQGLVIRVTNYKDTDALLTVLTRDHGKLTAKARGLRRKNSPLAASCQLLAYGEFTLFEYRNMYTINEAQIIELFSGLRKDLQKLSLGTYFAQVAEVLSQEDMPNPELLGLTLNCLHGLCYLNLADNLVKSVFELRSACIAGYTPDLSGCHVCADPYPDRLNIKDGVLECSRCGLGNSTALRMPITTGMLDAMRYICFCDGQRLFSFSLGENTLEQLSYVTESYLSSQLERGFSALDFYKSLVVPIEQPNIGE